MFKAKGNQLICKLDSMQIAYAVGLLTQKQLATSFKKFVGQNFRYQFELYLIFITFVRSLLNCVLKILN